jgi:hypothetical protein
MTTADRIYQELEGLPEQVALEVLDFAKFLKQKNREGDLVAAQSSSLNQVWGSAEDDVWNDVPTR